MTGLRNRNCCIRRNPQLSRSILYYPHPPLPIHLEARFRNPSSINRVAMLSSAVLRKTFAFEAILNLVGNLPLILQPHTTLSLLAPPSSITPLSITLCQWMGLVTASFSVPMFLAGRRRSGFRERRLIVYQLLATEVSFICLLGFQSWGSVAEVEMKAIARLATCLVPFCGWRAWVLVDGEDDLEDGHKTVS